MKYPNGGINQPNCPTTSQKLLSAIFNLAILSVDGIEQGVSCSHNSAIDFFTDSIANKCKYTAYPCNTKEEFDKGACLVCSSRIGCNRMGYWSEKSKENGLLFLNTQSPVSKPFCKQNYRIDMTSNDINGLKQTRGKFTVYFITENYQVVLLFFYIFILFKQNLKNNKFNLNII
jgi:hypothetical protein